MDLLNSQYFLRSLYLERKRSERSGRGFVLMLLETKASVSTNLHRQILNAAASVVGRVKRDTDLSGWYEDGCVLGILFAEFGCLTAQSALDILEAKISGALVSGLGEGANQISLSSFVFSGHRDRSGLESLAPVADETFSDSSTENVAPLSGVAVNGANSLIERDAATNGIYIDR